MITINSTLTSIPERPAPCKRLRKYAPPPAPQMRKYRVEIKRGADTTMTIPWWGPLDVDAMFVEMEIKHRLIPTQCWY